MTQGFTKYAYVCVYVCNNLENLLELVSVTLKWILLPFSKQFVLFLIHFLFYLTVLPRLHTQFFCFFSHTSCLFKHIYLCIYTLRRNNPERTLNYNVDEKNTIKQKNESKVKERKKRCFTYSILKSMQKQNKEACCKQEKKLELMQM